MKPISRIWRTLSTTATKNTEMNRFGEKYGTSQGKCDHFFKIQHGGGKDEELERFTYKCSNDLILERLTCL